MAIMKPAHPLRFTTLLLGCLILALIVGLHSASIAAIRKAPQTATALFPLNGLAQENVASAIFTLRVESGSNPGQAALFASELARNAYRLEPLAPEAHAILSLSQKEEQDRSKTIDAASKLNRRNKMLQALVLERHVSAQNYSEVLKTLDQILRVRPSRSQDLYPVMLAVFVQKGAVEEFQKILNGTSPWHQNFLNFAVTQPGALLNLAELRLEMNFNDREFDRALLLGLAREGQYELAHSLYNEFNNGAGIEIGRRTLSWDTTYAPFDWQLTDSSDFRAQRSLNDENLELYVRPGQGGIFAQRIIKSPPPPFTISAEQLSASTMPNGKMEMSLKCMPSGKSINETEFETPNLLLTIEELPEDCSFIAITLSARAWSGQAVIRGAISPLIID